MAKTLEVSNRAIAASFLVGTVWTSRRDPWREVKVVSWKWVCGSVVGLRVMNTRTLKAHRVTLKTFHKSYRPKEG